MVNALFLHENGIEQLHRTCMTLLLQWATGALVQPSPSAISPLYESDCRQQAHQYHKPIPSRRHLCGRDNSTFALLAEDLSAENSKGYTTDMSNQLHLYLIVVNEFVMAIPLSTGYGLS